MRMISNWLIAKSTGWMMAGTALIMLGFMIFILPAQSRAAEQISGDGESPDLSFSYSPEGLYQMAGEYGPGGRKSYIQARWSFDLLYPLVYTSFLAIGISWFKERLPDWSPTWKLANLVPLLAGVFDLLENSGTSLAMALYPERIQAVLLTAVIATPLKWILVGSSFSLYLILGGGFLIKSFKKR